jgi:HECT-domain (ubiquitin-transferase)
LVRHHQIFDCEELEIIINGLPFIDVYDWKLNTEYRGEFSKDHPVMKWFWEYVELLNPNQLQSLLQFSTGSTRTPIEGFRYHSLPI